MVLAGQLVMVSAAVIVVWMRAEVLAEQLLVDVADAEMLEMVVFAQAVRELSTVAALADRLTAIEVVAALEWFGRNSGSEFVLPFAELVVD